MNYIFKLPLTIMYFITKCGFPFSSWY